MSVSVSGEDTPGKSAGRAVRLAMLSTANSA